MNYHAPKKNHAGHCAGCTLQTALHGRAVSRVNLHFEFDGLGEWEAESSVTDGIGGVPFMWRIHVCDDGTFTVQDSDSELTTRRDTFTTLRLAQDYCNVEERKLVEASEGEDAYVGDES